MDLVLLKASKMDFDAKPQRNRKGEVEVGRIEMTKLFFIDEEAGTAEGVTGMNIQVLNCSLELFEKVQGHLPCKAECTVGFDPNGMKGKVQITGIANPRPVYIAPLKNLADLPPTDPRRIEAERSRAEAAAASGSTSTRPAARPLGDGRAANGDLVGRSSAPAGST